MAFKRVLNKAFTLSSIRTPKLACKETREKIAQRAGTVTGRRLGRFGHFWWPQEINEEMVFSNGLFIEMRYFCNLSLGRTNTCIGRINLVIGCQLREDRKTPLVTCSVDLSLNEADHLDNTFSENALELLKGRIQPSS